MKKYALLISGGVDASHNYGRYLNDITEMYNALRDNYGYEKDDIFVLYGAGNSHDLDGDGQNEISNPATKEKVVEAFNDLKNKMTDDDLLFIFTTNHGGQSSPNTNNARLWLWQHEYIEDVEFKTYLDQLKCALIIITMGQCYSGGFLDNLPGPNRIIATACDWNEVSYSCDSEGNYDEFVFYWTAAVRGKKPDGSVVNAGGSDGNVSIKEAFQFAKVNDSRNEHPQYYENPTGIGDKYTLAGPIALKLACGNIRQDLRPACRFIKPDLRPACGYFRDDLKPICGFTKLDIKIPDCILHAYDLPIPCYMKPTKIPDVTLRDPDIKVKAIEDAKIALKEAYIGVINYLTESGLSGEEIENVFLEINDQELNKTCESSIKDISKPCFNHIDITPCQLSRKVIPIPCSPQRHEICKVSTQIPDKCSQYRLDFCKIYYDIKIPDINPCITTRADLHGKTCWPNDQIIPGGCYLENPQIDPSKIRIDPIAIIQIMREAGYSEADIASQLEMTALEMAEQQKYFQMMAEEVKGNIGKHFKRMTRR